MLPQEEVWHCAAIRPLHVRPQTSSKSTFETGFALLPAHTCRICAKVAKQPRYHCAISPRGWRYQGSNSGPTALSKIPGNRPLDPMVRGREETEEETKETKKEERV